MFKAVYCILVFCYNKYTEEGLKKSKWILNVHKENGRSIISCLKGHNFSNSRTIYA